MFHVPSLDALRTLSVCFVRNDERSFQRIIALNEDRVFNLCARMLGDRHEAQDATQDVFLSAYQNLSEFRGEAQLTTWLFRIARNQCLNRLRSRSRRQRQLGSDPVELSPSPDEALDSREAGERISRAIERLDPEYRELVVLRDIEGLTYEDIVEITKLPLGTVKSRLHRARERLVELMGGRP